MNCYSGISPKLKRVCIGYALLMLAGCVAQPDGDSSSSVSVSLSSSAASSLGALTGDIERGARLFEQQCDSCHDTDVLGIGTYTIETLTDVIDTTMPLENPSACDKQCSLDIALFISVDNPDFGQDPTQSDERFDAITQPNGIVDAAPVLLNRLNNTQYNNTVRDLFGSSQTPADNFPEDNRGGAGQYDTIAGSLSISLTHVEQHVIAAEALADEVISGKVTTPLHRIEAENQTTEFNVSIEGGVLSLRATGSRLIANFNGAGEFVFTVRAGQDAAGDENAHMRVLVDNVEIGTADVASPREMLSDYIFSHMVEGSGSHTLVVEFANDLFVEGELNRNLVVDWIEVRSQSASVATNVIPCDISTGLACARQVIDNFGPKAWRRPLSDEEKNSLETVYADARQIGGNETYAFSQLVKAFVLSPHFLYRPELDPDLHSSEPRMLNAYELASRLSYFIWNTTPDDNLLALARSGELLNESTLRQQIRGMLLDPKASESFVESFLVQWLKIDSASAPSSEHFPEFSTNILDLMRQESRLFLKELFESNAAISDIATANFTYLNETLAQHYGVTGITGNEFRRHQWDEDAQRRGVLGQGSFLTATSHPVITSPVKRGVWILTNLICKEPPPPPQGVNTEIVLDPNLTARQISELHRESGSSCFGCHSLMDPLGFGLENFDSAGQWRWMDGQHMVDASGFLPGGLQFNGPLELSEILGDSPRLPMCAIDHMMTYGLGRGTEAFHSSDGSSEANGYTTVYEVYRESMKSGHSIHSIIEEIVLSPAFRMRRGADSEEI